MERYYIDPSVIPPEEYDRACAIFAADIERLLADPDIRKEYEEWKATQKGGETNDEG